MENGERQFQKHYERYRQVLERLTLMSDIFMRNVLKKPECAEYVLQVIMDNPTLKVTELVIQKDYKNLQGKSAILDCLHRMQKASSIILKSNRRKKVPHQSVRGTTVGCWT